MSSGAVRKGKTWAEFCNTVRLEGEKPKGEVDGSDYGEKKGIKLNLPAP